VDHGSTLAGLCWTRAPRRNQLLLDTSGSQSARRSTCLDAERASVRCERPCGNEHSPAEGLVLGDGGGCRCRRLLDRERRHRKVFPLTTRSIVLGCTSRPNSSWINLASSRARIDSPGTSCVLGKCQYLGLDLVRTAWAALLGHQPRDACFLEVCLGLVIGRPRDAVLAGSLCH
jgi:hypothetical protein